MAMEEGVKVPVEEVETMTAVVPVTGIATGMVPV
jgi:hypothetical protein